MVLVKQKSIFGVENPLPRSLLGGDSTLASGQATRGASEEGGAR